MVYCRYNRGREVHTMINTDTLRAYEEYKVECYWEGKTPVSLWAWLEGKE